MNVFCVCLNCGLFVVVVFVVLCASLLMNMIVCEFVFFVYDCLCVIVVVFVYFRCVVRAFVCSLICCDNVSCLFCLCVSLFVM